MKTVTSFSMKIAEGIAVEKGSSYLDLMEAAGKGAFLALCASFDPAGKKVLILCGKGNNGGDGLVLARYLKEAGANVSVAFLLGDSLSPLSRSNFYLIEKSVPFLSEKEEIKKALTSAELIVDAVFGTGFSGELPKNCKELFSIANQSNALKIALDIPSGINSDNGFTDKDAFCANRTYTFGAKKPCHVFKESAPFCGVVEVIDIGISPSVFESISGTVDLITKEQAQSAIPKRFPTSHKGSYGTLLALCGALSMPGAAMMSVASALRCGAGLVKAGVVSGLVSLLAVKTPEAVFLPLPTSKNGSISENALPFLRDAMPSATAILVGCGIGVNGDTEALVHFLIQNSTVPLVIDADGLNCLSKHISWLKEKKAPILLTPHMKEMSRLCGYDLETIRSRRFDVASRFAAEYDVTLVLKDSNTVIASPDGKLSLSVLGNSGLSKGGSGDVLAGMIASFLAQGALPYSAALTGVYLHGAAADIAAKTLTEYSLLPSDVIETIPFAIASL